MARNLLNILQLILFVENEVTDLNQYWIPRIRLLFRSECAVNFSKRVSEAYYSRKRAEGLIRFVVNTP